MTFSSCLTDQHTVIVMDASVVINLLATGCSAEILQALKMPSLVTENVFREIGQGANSGRQEPKLLSNLIGTGVLQMVELSGSSLEYFFKMVSGSTADSLGDGEASTVAYAYTNGIAAAIDEKKATRIASNHFGSVKLVTTLDILAYEPVRDSLGRDVLASATVRALQFARMQVRTHQLDWVTELIGQANFFASPSLKRHARHLKSAANQTQ